VTGKGAKTMSALQAAAFYAGINMLILVVLTVMVIRLRRKLKCAIGDGGHHSLMLAIRAHSNASEVIPVALIGLVALGATGAGVMMIHFLGVLLTLGRALHAYALSNSQGPSFGRIAGMGLSLTSIVATGVMCIASAF
jgi:uncharacterized protein